MRSSSGEYYQDYTAKKGRGYKELMNQALTFFSAEELVGDLQDLKAKEKLRILVLGTADGSAAVDVPDFDQALRSDKAKNDQTVLIDIHDIPLQTALAHRSPERGQISSVQTDIKNIGLTAETFDLAFSDYTLNFLDDEEEVRKAMAEISSSLKLNGLVFCRFKASAREKGAHLSGTSASNKITVYPFVFFLQTAQEANLKLVTAEVESARGPNLLKSMESGDWDITACFKKVTPQVKGLELL